MKRITIYQEKSEPLTLVDHDDTDLTEYSKKLSSILDSPVVTILETTTQNVIIRPNKITSIEVVEDNIEDLKKYEDVVEEDDTPDFDLEVEDFITDGD